MVVGVSVGAAEPIVRRDVAGGVVADRAHGRRVLRDLRDAVRVGGVAECRDGLRSARRRGAVLHAVSDAIVIERLRAPGAVGILEAIG